MRFPWYVQSVAVRLSLPVVEEVTQVQHLSPKKPPKIRKGGKTPWSSNSVKVLCPRANHNVVARAGMFQAFLGGSGGGHGLGDLRNLVTSPDDFLALVILRILNVLVLLLCSLPNLNLATATNDTNTHGRE